MNVASMPTAVSVRHLGLVILGFTHHVVRTGPGVCLDWTEAGVTAFVLRPQAEAK